MHASGAHRYLAARLARNSWLQAFFLAAAVLLLLRAFVIQFVTVQSTSMFATLRPGDLLLVQRWPVWTGLERGDAVVFRDPLKDRAPMLRRPLLVKRLVALPGDTVEIRRGTLFVNGTRRDGPEGLTFSHLVRMREGADPETVVRRHGLPAESVRPGTLVQELPLNAALAHSLEADPEVVSVAPMRLASGALPQIFPYSPRYAWNGDDFGPLTVPRSGDTLLIDADNLPLYDRLISIYEGHRIGNSGDLLLLDGLPMKRYLVEQDYGFVLGDSRHFSADSRYWGFLPLDHIVGRCGPVLMSEGD